MRPVATTRQELFPDAPLNGRLKVFPPVDHQINARAWSRVLWGGFWVCAASVLAPVLLFGSAVTVLFGYGLLLMLGAACLIGVALFRLHVRGYIRRDRRVPWHEWARARGLMPAEGRVRRPSGFSVFDGGYHREWGTLWRGRVGEFPAIVGSTSWLPEEKDANMRRRIFFVYVELPAGVADTFPATSFTRHFRTIAGVDLRVPGAVLRPESTLLDDTAEIRVAARTADHPRWRRLFDPVTIDGLAHTYDVQWQQAHNRIVFCVGGVWLGRAPEHALDTMCLGAAFVAQRFARAARADAATADPAPATWLPRNASPQALSGQVQLHLPPADERKTA